LVRRLQPYYTNIGKRLVKSPKTYIRDSGLLHALLGIANHNTLAGHPVVGMSWEGFVIENLIAASPQGTKAQARDDLQLGRCFVVYSGQDRYPLAEGVEVVSLAKMTEILSTL